MDKPVKDMAFLLKKYGAKVGATDDFQADVLEVFETLKRKAMKTGIELIAIERAEQIEKHRRTVKEDTVLNCDGELRRAAISLIGYDGSADFIGMPHTWNEEICMRMCRKTYKERLIIAGALIAAEIDRINAEP